LADVVRAALPLTVLLAAALGAGCSADDSPDATSSSEARLLQPGRPGEDNTTLTGDVPAAENVVTEADVAFMQHMVEHHAQAIEMVQVSRAHLTDVEVRAIADRIRDAQGPEISLMVDWLVANGEAVPEQAEAAGVDLEQLGAEVLEGAGGGGHGAHGPDGHQATAAPMPGMATPEQVAALGAARGTEADRMFLELMMAHHDGAVTMVEQHAAEGLDVRATEMAREMYAEQLAEIGRMQDLLDQLPD
jgi:uncharacterized protein (DUF305 family)